MESKAGAQRYLLGLWIVLSVMTPLTGYLGARGFAPLVGFIGLLSLGYLKPRGPDWIGFGLLAALVAWSCVTVLWTPAPNLKLDSLKSISRFTAWHMGLQIVLSGAMVMAAARMRPGTAKAALLWLSYGLVALALILVLESVSQAALYQRLQHVIGQTVRPDLAVRNVAVGGYVLAVLIWPAAAILQRSKQGIAALLLVLAVIFSTFMLRGDSPTLALVVSAIVFALVLRFGRPAVLGTGAIALAYWLATPMTMLAMDWSGLFARIHGHLPPSWDRRLEIWSFTLGQWVQHPVRGWGLDASRAFKGLIALHPHDGALQAWFELGAPGAVLIAGFWTLLFWRIAAAARERLFAAAACAAATVYLVIGAISFSLWQEWWLCIGAMALAACVALRRSLAQDMASPTPAAGA